MAKTDSILAIDIGACSLKLASFSFPATGGLVLQKFAYTEFAGELRDDEYKLAMREALHSIVAEHGFDEKTAYFSFSGQEVFIRFVDLPPIGGDESRIRQVVEFEAKQNVPFPIDEVIWDYQLVGDIADESGIETMFVVVKRDIVEDLTMAVEELGKETALVDVAPTVAYNAARANGIGEDDCSIILNIGGKCSSLIFIDSGKFFVRPIPIAGFTVTQQISKEFGIPFEDAEELKKKHGFVALGGAYEEPDSEVAATVSKIVRNVMTRLHGELNRSINVYRSQRKGSKPTKLYLAGGSSVMAFTPRFFAEKLKIPVEYFNPFQVVSLAPHIDKEKLAEVAHMFSETIGLGLRHAAECPIEISLLPPSVQKRHELRRKTPYFLASAASLILCMLIFLGAVDHNRKRSENLVASAQSMLEQTSAMLDKINTAKDELDVEETEYQTAMDLLKPRARWVELLDELQKILPDNMWLVRIAPTSAPVVETEKTKKPTARGGFSIGSFMGERRGTATKTSAVGDVEWLELKGYSLSLDFNTVTVQIFNDRLLKSPLFTDSQKEIVPKMQRGLGYNDNLFKFTMAVKLAKPIKR